jgi:membrane protease YdiL (CAAX protease family)
MFSNGKPLSFLLYLIGVVVILVTVYVPYFIRVGTVTGYLIVYGIPLVVVSLIFGKQILRRAAKNNKEAFGFSFGIFSLFFVAGIFISAIALVIIIQFNPSAKDLILLPNPALDVSPEVAWILIAVSMLVIGPAEEYLFRGFLFGGLLSVTKGRFWIPVAVVSSLVFSLAHGYYAVTYGVASPVFFIQLMTFGVAMCVAYYWSGGNILALAIVHGLNNAIGFLGVATTDSIGLAARWIFIAVGLALGVFYVIMKKVRINPTRTSEAPPPETGEQPAPAISS